MLERTSSEFRMNTFLRNLELAALGNLHCLNGLVTWPLRHVFNILYNIVAFENFAEDNVAPIEPAGDRGRNEELRAIRIFPFGKCQPTLKGFKAGMSLPRVGHAEKTLAAVFELEVLVWEFGSIDGFATGSVT